MAVVNRGAVVEGIFGICLGILLTKDRVDETSVMQYRRMADPARFTSGTGQMIQFPTVKVGKDTVKCRLFMRMKRDAAGAFGVEGYDSMNDPALDKMVKAVVSTVRNLPSVNKLMREKFKFVKNNTTELLDFKVEVDGVSGESSNGDIKTDVAVRLVVTDKVGNEIEVANSDVIFSLKAQSMSLETRGIQSIFKSVTETFKLRQSAVINAASRTLTTKPKTSEGKEFRKEAGYTGFEELYNKLKTQEQSSRMVFSSRAYDYLESCLFGNDYPEVVKIGVADVKVLNREVLRLTRRTNPLTIRYRSTPGSEYIEFVSVPANEVLYFIRLGESGEKFQIKVEAGPYLYRLAKIFPSKAA